MSLKPFTQTMMLLLALAPLGAAHAADTETACRLRGGSIVPLPAEACAKEGGTMVTVTVKGEASGAPLPTPAAPAMKFELSPDPKKAAPQKAILELLSKPVAGVSKHSKVPEGIEREAKFDDCTLSVDEHLVLDYGGILSDRKEYNISSKVDFRELRPEEFGMLGKVDSKSGQLKAYAVYLAKPGKRGEYLAISILELEGDSYKKFISPGIVPYWETSNDYFWMVDRYGYVAADNMGHVSTDKVRILYLVNLPDDAALLKKAFDDMQAACRKAQ